jgi:hypothetical protein
VFAVSFFLFFKTKKYMTAENRPVPINTIETIKEIVPAAPLPSLKSSETRTKPLKPKKSTMDASI